jgi:hypothetical protein
VTLDSSTAWGAHTTPRSRSMAPRERRTFSPLPPRQHTDLRPAAAAWNTETKPEELPSRRCDEGHGSNGLLHYRAKLRVPDLERIEEILRFGTEKTKRTRSWESRRSVRDKYLRPALASRISLRNGVEGAQVPRWRAPPGNRNSTTPKVRDILDLVPTFTKGIHDRAIYALVGEAGQAKCRWGE